MCRFRAESPDDRGGGLAPLNNGVPLHIQATSYPEALTITRAAILEAEGGNVPIGQ